MDPIKQINLDFLMTRSRGSPEIVIGLIDGPVELDHVAFNGSRLRAINDLQRIACTNADSLTCLHGTFIAGILCATRGVRAPAICPSCEVILHPVFSDQRSANNSTISPKQLSMAIMETVEAGARIINLSVGLAYPDLRVYRELEEAFRYAMRSGVIVVAATGNQGSIGFAPIVNHPWIVPVAACDCWNRPMPSSNFGPSIGKMGFLAPGISMSSYPRGKFGFMSGTSVSAPFVSGTIALLWSIFPEAKAEEIIYCLQRSTLNCRRTIIPPLLDAKAAWKNLNRIYS